MNLSELIETHKGRRSYPDLERDCGGKPSSKRLQQLVKDSISNFPDPPTIAALARGLRVPQRVVIMAAAESLGLDVHDTAPRVMQLMPSTASDLSEAQAAAVAHLVDVIVNDPQRTAGAPQETPEDKTDRRARTEPKLPSLAERRRAAGLDTEDTNPVDEDLDALPDERDEPAPKQGGRRLPAAARRTDRP